MKKLDRETIEVLLERMEAIGINFDWHGPVSAGHFAGLTLSVEAVLMGVCSEAKHPLETITLDVTDDEYEKWLAWFHGQEGEFNSQQCLGKTKKGTQCKGTLACEWDYRVPIKDFEKFAFCRLHRPGTEKKKVEPKPKEKPFVFPSKPHVN